MVDLDEFTRRAAPGWRGTAKAIRDGSPPGMVAAAVERELYQYLRQHRGLHDPLLARLYAETTTFRSEYTFRREMLAHTLERLVRFLCIERVVPRLVDKGWFGGDVEQAEAYCARVLAAVDLPRGARLLDQHRDGVHLRRPPHRKVATAVLLDEDAPPGAA